MSGGAETTTTNNEIGGNGAGKGSLRKKSSSAFRTISEVSKHLDLPQHVLRFWETKFPQVSPMKRGGGRRYYRPEDVEVLSRIRSLLHDEGYTIKGVQKLLKKPGAMSALGKEKHGEKSSIDGFDGVGNSDTSPVPGAQQNGNSGHHAGNGGDFEQKAITGGLSRVDAEKLLAELVSARESLKKFS